ncbi:MAG: n-acetylglutamate synthase [Bacteroidota bacterium]
MPEISYDGRHFKPVSNAANGEVSGETVFSYPQRGDIVWATYEGGSVRFGTLVASVAADGCLDMRYAHVNTSGEMMTGECHSTPEVLPDGRLRLHERWRWTSGDESAGESIIEEIMPPVRHA